jgi:plastocyanin
MRHPIFWILARRICLLLLTLSACNNPSTPKPPRIPTPLDLSTVGTVSGQVHFEGTVPDQTILQLGGWSACAVQHPDGLPQTADVLVHDGKLQNAVVYIKQGLGERIFAVPTKSVTSDQTGCLFLPRIMAVRVDQPLQFLNSDPTAHNVHGLPQQARPWNFSLGVKGASRTINIETPENIIPIKCDIHGWMRAYIGVFDHPYFAVTDANGSFSLPDIPPGDYIIEAWHERFGTQEQPVTLGEKGQQELVFTFRGKE